MMLPYPTLKQGMAGPEIGALQRCLGLPDDEVFGPATYAAVVAFQADHALPADGVVGPQTFNALTNAEMIPFVQARYYAKRWPSRLRDVRQIVIHTIECLESNLNAAEDNALWFAGKTPYPPNVASAHYLVDQDSIVQSVREGDIAYHANQANEHGMGIEHAGYAKQTAADWADAASTRILGRSARLTAAIARRYSIPLVRLTPAQVRANEKGFCGHADVTLAYGNVGGHTDPGWGFPWDTYLALVGRS